MARVASIRRRGPKLRPERARSGRRAPKNRYFEGFARVCQAPFSRQNTLRFLFRPVAGFSHTVLYTFGPPPASRAAWDTYTRSSVSETAPWALAQGRASGLTNNQKAERGVIVTLHMVTVLQGSSWTTWIPCHVRATSAGAVTVTMPAAVTVTVTVAVPTYICAFACACACACVPAL